MESSVREIAGVKMRRRSSGSWGKDSNKASEVGALFYSFAGTEEQEHYQDEGGWQIKARSVRLSCGEPWMGAARVPQRPHRLLNCGEAQPSRDGTGASLVQMAGSVVCCEIRWRPRSTVCLSCVGRSKRCLSRSTAVQADLQRNAPSQGQRRAPSQGPAIISAWPGFGKDMETEVILIV
ncbi:hypothetical protein FH972_025580 [Carpinus fangiana]|uniref:Uncharacterized protein n=1 Tax=Carpinus fangiana TaxID=176857 RepID=A0A5N6L1F4_9ROSI|nr:hypothetical protein FH972_025580 [Carpinus fangiana]